MGRKKVERTSGPILSLGKTEYVSSSAEHWLPEQLGTLGFAEARLPPL